MSSEDPRDILVVVERHQGSVTDISMEVLGAARQLAEGTQGRVIAVVVGSADISNTDSLATADRIIHIDDPLLDDYRPGPVRGVPCWGTWWLSITRARSCLAAPRLDWTSGLCWRPSSAYL